jgi:hypothetical protein
MPGNRYISRPPRLQGERSRQASFLRSLRRGPGSPRAGRPRRLRTLPFFAVLAGLLVPPAATPARAWTPRTQQTIAWEAARLAPPDLARQLVKRRGAYLAGVIEPFDDSDPERHRKHPDGSGSLDRALADAVAQAVTAIRTHRPFDEIVFRMGRAAHYMADANNPLATAATDPEAGRYFVDYLRYAETAEPRFPLIFYGLQPGLDRAPDVSALLAETLSRGRALYPMIGLEYRNIDFASGIGRFDDHSTAFGVASVAFSHAVTDVTQVLRYIWIRAGGGDDRAGLPAGGTRLLLLPRAGLPPASTTGP